MSLDVRLVSPKERPLFRISFAVSAVAWAALVISIVGALYGVGIALFVLAAQALFLAHLRGNAVRLGDGQLPELYERCKAAAKKLGLSEVPEIYVMQSHGVLNAFASRLLSRRFVVLYSSLVESCKDPAQLDFVIGHELGHLAAGHLTWNTFLAPAMIVPWLGAAYSRAREYTCDRCGLETVGALEPAMRGLVVLAAGGHTAAQVDLDAYQRQRLESGGFWMAVLELNSSHPFLCKRVAALVEFKNPGTVPAVARAPLAYPLAPLFGFASPSGGGALAMVAIIGIMAAIAIPNFIKFQERAKQARAQQMKQAAPADDGETEPVR